MKNTLAITFNILIGLFVYSAFAAEPVTVQSPDGKIVFSVQIKEKLYPNPSGERLYYTLRYKEKDILLESSFGLEFENMPPLAENLEIINTTRQTIDTQWQRVWGKRKNVTNYCNELKLELKETRLPNRRIDFIIRVFDDGAAFRYAFPQQSGITNFILTAERTRFHLADNYRCWAATYGGFASHQESEFNEMKINDLTPAKPYGCPVLAQVDRHLWIALTEADLTDWAGLYFTHTGTQLNTLVSAMAPAYDDPSVLVKSAAPCASPWRVVMIGKKPGDLIESDIIQNLNDPCAIEDVSWITSGKSAWDRWWCGDYLPDADFKIGMNQQTMKYFIDFAAEMGWEYQLVDWQWYGDPFHPDYGSRYMNPEADITQSIPEVDIPALVKYANSKGVKLLIWLEWNAVDKQMDEAFPLYEKWGVSGVKIDFMARDDQYMVNFYHRCVKKAAEHHLVVDFHGAYKPTGWSRTYPNVITREGVLGNEYTKWSDKITPDHCLTLPFTRGLFGEMDFTPGGFRQKTVENFRAVGSDAPGPFVMGTRCYQLAMMVVYESALQVVCDSPYNYRSSPAGLDFLEIVPTTWDDTKVIAGQVGDYITVARRSGSVWYVGCMTDTTARTLDIPLDFLDSGTYKAEIWMDAYEANDYPDRLMKKETMVDADYTIKAKLARSGGYVVVLTPIQ